MGAPVQLAEIGQIAVTVKDLPRAVAFYRDVLGVPFRFEAPPGLAFFQCGPVSLMLSLPEPGFDGAGSVIYFTVPEIIAAHHALAAKGVRFREAPHLIHRAGTRELWMAFFRDPDENPLALMSWREAAEP